MKLATMRDQNRHRLAIVTATGLVDVANSLPGVAEACDVGQLLSLGDPARAAVNSLAADPSQGIPYTGEPEFAPPVLAPSKIIGIGLNYRRHAAEGGVRVPDRPILFAKFPSALVGAGAPVFLHPITKQLDYEAELAVVIGRRARSVVAEDAQDYVAGYVCANDISARDLQHGQPGAQWLHGKTLDSFCPTGPYLVTPDEIGDWRQIRIRAWVNGELRQDELCADMVFGVEQLIAFITAGITLEPGDMILTGTPAGVGLGFEPPKWLTVGDVVEVELSGLGRLTSPVVTGDSPVPASADDTGDGTGGHVPAARFADDESATE